MWRLKSCARCGGDVMVDYDQYGWHMQCLQCGSLWELADLTGIDNPPAPKKSTVTQGVLKKAELIYIDPK